MLSRDFQKRVHNLSMSPNEPVMVMDTSSLYVGGGLAPADVKGWNASRVAQWVSSKGYSTSSFISQQIDGVALLQLKLTDVDHLMVSVFIVPISSCSCGGARTLRSASRPICCHHPLAYLPAAIARSLVMSSIMR